MSLLRDALIRETKACLDACYERIDHCVKQLGEEQVWRRPAKGMNSIGNLVLHLTGNIRQWIIAGLGGAADSRDRPAEFSEDGPLPTEQIMAALRDAILESKLTLDKLDEAQLLEPRRIQGFELDGVKALFDTIPHFKGHTQEIICLTRMQKGADYCFHWQPSTPEQGA